MRRRGWVWPALTTALAGPLTEAGHALAYLGRYGQPGLRIESTGVHAYFPDLLRLTGGAVGLFLLTCLLLRAGCRFWPRPGCSSG